MVLFTKYLKTVQLKVTLCNVYHAFDVLNNMFKIA